MEPSYLYEEEFKKAVFQEPQIFRSTSRNISLFTVPHDNSVGTNDIGNAITVISFPKGKVSYDKYFRNAVDDIGGGGIFLPVITPDIIGFGQERVFILYDFKKKLHREFEIMRSIEQYINKIAIADAKQLHIMFEIEKQNSRSNDPWDVSRILQLMDLSGEKPKMIKAMPKEAGVAWSVVSGKLFLYARKKEHLQVLNMSFEPTHHPLADEINRNKGKISFTWIHAHPYLPFAILSGGEHGATIIAWGDGRKNPPHLLSSGAREFSFSPDGKWVALKKKEYDKGTVGTYLMPVSEKYPYYLGSPILLLNNDITGNKSAWTTNPVSFVGSCLDSIYRWDLTNRPHPESDRKTFHDYIVERDLEKLSKEKRQGLGENGSAY